MRLALLGGRRHTLGQVVVGRGVVPRDVDDFVAVVVVVIVVEGIVKENVTFNLGKIKKSKICTTSLLADSHT